MSSPLPGESRRFPDHDGLEQADDILDRLRADVDIKNLILAIAQGGPVGGAARLLGERLSALALSRDLLAELDAVRKRKS